ncbi:MAG TPA: proline--tRNA ligase, partial [Pirellulales bacterium]
VREKNTKRIDTKEEFIAYFTPKNAENPEPHGGFALCHFCNSPEMETFLKEHKVTIRCVPLDGPEEDGKCFLTGHPSKKRAIFAKAY